MKECAQSFIEALGDETGLSSMARSRLESTAKAFEGLLSKSSNRLVIDFGEKGVNVDALVTLADQQADELMTNAFSRKTLEADAEAARLMANAGYDVAEYKTVREAAEVRRHREAPPADERVKFVEEAISKSNTLPKSGGVKPSLLAK